MFIVHDQDTKADTVRPQRSPATANQTSRSRGWIIGGVAATALLGLAAINRTRSRKAEIDNPAVGSFVTVAGGRLHYTDEGSGTPVMLLHGNGVMLQDFAASGVTDLASARYRVIAFSPWIWL